jgi:hypothetical protein
MKTPFFAFSVGPLLALRATVALALLFAIANSASACPPVAIASVRVLGCESAAFSLQPSAFSLQPLHVVPFAVLAPQVVVLEEPAHCAAVSRVAVLARGERRFRLRDLISLRGSERRRTTVVRTTVVRREFSQLRAFSF